MTSQNPTDATVRRRSQDSSLQSSGSKQSSAKDGEAAASALGSKGDSKSDASSDRNVSPREDFGSSKDNRTSGKLEEDASSPSSHSQQQDGKSSSDKSRRLVSMQLKTEGAKYVVSPQPSRASEVAPRQQLSLSDVYLHDFPAKITATRN